MGDIRIKTVISEALIFHMLFLNTKSLQSLRFSYTIFQPLNYADMFFHESSLTLLHSTEFWPF